MNNQFLDGGLMGEKIRAYDWCASPMGCIDTWPQSLCTAVSIMMQGKIPMYIGWGKDFVQFYNDAYRPILGSKINHEPLGRPCSETWSEIWPVIGPMFNEVLSGKAIGFNYFNLFLERYGFLEETYFDFSYSPIRMEDGMVGGLFLSCLETTERVLYERRLKTLAALAEYITYSGDEDIDITLQSHLSLSGNPYDIPYSLLYALDNDGKIALRSSFGIAGTPALTAVGINNLEQTQTGSSFFTLPTAQLLTEEVTFTDQPWTEIPALSYIMPLRLTGSRQTDYLLVTGISARLAFDDRYKDFLKLAANHICNALSYAATLEKERHRLKEIEELSARKDEFISIASHELKTPLTSVKAYLQLLKTMVNEADKGFPFVDKASNHVLRLEKLISDLLDVSKINAGQLEFNMNDFDFKTMLEETVQGMQQLAPKHTIVLHNNADVIVKGDSQRLEQVIQNFISNAVKYSPEKDTIIVTSGVQENNVVVAIQDFGIGIAKENMKHLFERFYRIDNTAMKYQGLGLGLYIASEIIRRHHGTFWIESEPGKGSTFYFLLPLSENNSTAKAIQQAQTYYCDDKITITYNAAGHWLETDWTGYQNIDTVQKGALLMLDIMAANRCTKVLNDNSHVLGTWAEAADWGREIWFPQMQQAGLKHFAWIYSPSTFARMAAQKTVNVLIGDVIVQFFTSKDEAIAWLRSFE